MTKTSSVPQSFLSPSVVWAEPGPYREPQSSVPVGIGELSEEEKRTSVVPQLQTDEGAGLRKTGIVSKADDSDAALADWARSFRKRFGNGLTLKRRTAYDDQCEGMVSGWRRQHENGDGV